MNKTVIRLYNVIDQTELPEVTVDKLPTDGDPIEIKGEMYYVCKNPDKEQIDQVVGVIPLVVRNPNNVPNIESYLKCLSLAHRKVLFKNEKGCCDMESCDEMVIS
jgi:hypothetical protein